MNKDKFRQKIKQELRKLDKEQVAHFAWRCAVRALPLLGSNRSFNFWNKKDRKKHIYAVFFALDFSAAHTNTYAKKRSRGSGVVLCIKLKILVFRKFLTLIMWLNLLKNHFCTMHDNYLVTVYPN